VLYTDQVLSLATKDSPKIMSMRAYIKATAASQPQPESEWPMSSLASSTKSATEPKIALVYAVGDIIRGPGELNTALMQP
jgi:hypothetical protein